MFIVQEKIPSLRLDCERSIIFLCKVTAKPKHASVEAACGEKRGRKPEKKKKETFFFLREGGRLFTGYLFSSHLDGFEEKRRTESSLV